MASLTFFGNLKTMLKIIKFNPNFKYLQCPVALLNNSFQCQPTLGKGTWPKLC